MAQKNNLLNIIDVEPAAEKKASNSDSVVVEQAGVEMAELKNDKYEVTNKYEALHNVIYFVIFRLMQRAKMANQLQIVVHAR